MKQSTELVKTFYQIIAKGIARAHPFGIAQNKNTELYRKSKKCALVHINKILNGFSVGSEERSMYQDMKKDIEETENVKVNLKYKKS